MPNLLNLSFKTYAYIFLSGIIIAELAWGYSQWLDYQALKFEHQISLQNEQALKDSLHTVAARDIILTSQVRDLSKDFEDMKGKNIALKLQNRALLDSLHVQGNASSTTLTDSSVLVKFDGRKMFTRFEGWTLADLRDTTKSKWDLKLWFDPIDVRTVLFKDADGLWKFRSTSLTEGVIISPQSTSTLDDNTFAALQKYGPPSPMRSFGLNLQANTRDFWGGLIFRYNDRWYFNINYRIINGHSSWSENALIGLSYFLF